MMKKDASRIDQQDLDGLSFIGSIHSTIVRIQLGSLVCIRSDHDIDLDYINVIELLHCPLNLLIIRHGIHNENNHIIVSSLFFMEESVLKGALPDGSVIEFSSGVLL